LIKGYQRNVKRALLVICILGGATNYANATDVWDASSSDGNSGTDNELIHGSEQVHDLQASAGVPDQDWFLLSQAPYSSYEVIVDGLTEEVAVIPANGATDALRVDEVDAAGLLFTGGVGISSHGSARSLRIRNGTGNPIDDHFVRVQSGANGCAGACTATAQYRIRLRETTLMIPRFNNTGSQTTVLIMQNGSRSTVNATVRFWSTAGVLLASQGFSMPARGGFVLSTPGVAGAAGASGMMTVDHDGRFGEVTGKSVALEPSTGFSFDTPAVPRLP